MTEHTYQVLGYYQLLDILSHYAACPLGRSDCLSLKPSNDPSRIDNQLQLIAEMGLCFKIDGFLSLTENSEGDQVVTQHGLSSEIVKALESHKTDRML